MNRHPRRQFIIDLIAVGATASTGSTAFAQAGAHVDEADEQAVALGYRQDSAKVDAKKYPKHTPDQHCANCSFWQGKPDDAWAGCAMFGRKHVAKAGWCQVWAKPPG
ncbi:MAG: high-potential iron-sulfur protein [Burkholderiales bacterium]